MTSLYVVRCLIKGIRWRITGRDLCFRCKVKKDLDTGLVAEHLLAWPSVGESTLIRSPMRLGGQDREGQPGLKGQHGQPDGKKDRADFSTKK